MDNGGVKVRAGSGNMLVAAVQVDVRDGDVQYARRQLELHRNRNRTGVCRLDSTVPCLVAWRCGFDYKTECCVNFVASVKGRNAFGGIPNSCRLCSRMETGRCVFACVRKGDGEKTVEGGG
jgi:hypothetical protein